MTSKTLPQVRFGFSYRLGLLQYEQYLSNHRALSQHVQDSIYTSRNNYKINYMVLTDMKHKLLRPSDLSRKQIYNKNIKHIKT